MTRYEIRECAFLLLFEKEFNDYEISELLDVTIESFDLLTDNAALAIVNGVIEKQECIDALISSYSTSRNIGRIPKVNLTLLRIALYEMDYCSNIPPKVAINEAIELSKKYGMEKDSVFISGLLGTHYRAVHENRKDEK